MQRCAALANAHICLKGFKEQKLFYHEEHEGHEGLAE